MSTTTTLLNINYGQLFTDMLNKGMESAANLFWHTITNLILEYWLPILIGYLIILTIAIIKLLSGRWGMFGSLLYHTLYFGILFIIGLIKGPTLFINAYFEVFCAILLYPFCYLVTRIILNKFRIC